MGQHEHHAVAPHRVTVAVVTLSDSRSPANDRTGDTIVALLEAAGHSVAGRELVREDPSAIRAVLDAALTGPTQAVILNGGTGIAPRDSTPEIVAPLLERELPGFGELFRQLSFQEIGAAAMLSRALAGVAHGKLLFALPGSETACRLALEQLILPELGHLVGELRKG
ncbi:MAG: molybdenum cofactor biosynthesis protein B [Candidatus Thermoplasmatota archaeon]|nr:molybdenum cofactor biosynthesis protein B [Candidatus Thermoplasmatota archaeon]